MDAQTTATLDIKALLEGDFNEETARLLYAQGEEVVVFVMMQLAALAKQSAQINGVHPSAPSGSVAAYQKEPGKKRKRRPGAKPGHKGSHRPPPENVTHHEEHSALCCPDCGGPLRRRNTTRKRFTEDIPKDITPEITEHTIHIDYCPKCKKEVSPVVPDAMPGATIGHRTVVLVALLHYRIGVTISKIIDIFNTQFFFKLTPGGLVHAWHALALVFVLWYQQIAEDARNSAVLHADETGWRVNGKTHWLWCFTNQNVTYFVIDQSRASPVVKRFFKTTFKGKRAASPQIELPLVVKTRFRWALVSMKGKRPTGAPVLLKYRLIGVVTPSPAWQMPKRLKRIVRDALRLRGKRERLEVAKYERLRHGIEKRIDQLMLQEWKNVNAKRLVKRLRRHRQELFVFLYDKNVPPDNNHAERKRRPC